MNVEGHEDTHYRKCESASFLSFVPQAFDAAFALLFFRSAVYGGLQRQVHKWCVSKEQNKFTTTTETARTQDQNRRGNTREFFYPRPVFALYSSSLNNLSRRHSLRCDKFLNTGKPGWVVVMALLKKEKIVTSTFLRPRSADKFLNKPLPAIARTEALVSRILEIQ
ncbi:hypothetical protein V5799_006570 [Amblyomma americanum]|uniref:Uncharacterized protein n=1 Tax=Amblyomma americanum TaxID=6943 RepID=A0AAQ4DW08_AMBAM